MKNHDFAPAPTYSQTSNENSAWVVVTTTVSHPDGSRSQRVRSLPNVDQSNDKSIGRYLVIFPVLILLTAVGKSTPPRKCSPDGPTVVSPSGNSTY
jgi:hypothetical protein